MLARDKVFKLGELFCGPGGIALGASMSEVKKGELLYKIHSTWASDYDRDSCETLSRNIHKKCLDHNTQNIFLGDIREMSIKNLPSCDGLAFGFPCNDFSIVGESKGLEGKFGPLYSYGVDYLRIHQPLWFMAENVTGLASNKEGQAFDHILTQLEQANYNVTPHLYKFEDYGIPQARHRIIIVGFRKDLDLFFKIPIATHSNNHRNCFDAITKPPIIHDCPNHELTRQSQSVIERLRYIGPGENAWSKNIPEELRLNVRGTKLSNIYRRLDPEKPAYTVTGSGGGGTHVYHWSEPRALTNRERARLQTFPDDYVFYGSKESVRKQIGMAVPPKGAEMIFNHILKTLVKIDYPSLIASQNEFALLD